MMVRGQLLEGVLERTARMLAQNYGIKVVIQGQECKTDGKIVYLPSIPEDAPEELINAVRGFVDHEVGHLVGSDPPAVVDHFIRQKKVPSNQEQILANLINLVEDRQIENRIRKTWPGSRKNLADCYVYLTNQAREKWDSFSTFDQVFFGLIAKFSDYNPTAYDSLLSEEAKGLVSMCVEKFGDRIPKLSCTTDSLDLGYELYEVLRQELDNKSEEENEDEETDSNKEQADKGLGDNNQASRESEDAEDFVERQTAFSTSVEDPLKTFLQENLNSQQALAEKDTSYQHNLASDDTYLPYSTEDDTVSTVEVLNRLASQSKVSEIRSTSGQYTKVVKRKLVNSLRASKKCYWLGGKESGRLNTKKLYKVPMGVTTGLYKQKIDTNKLNTCVGLLIDHSGSMSGKPLKLSTELCVTLGDAFNELQVPFFTAGFTTHPNAVTPPESSVYSRWCGLALKVYSDFGDNWREASLRLSQMPTAARANTLEGESILWACRKLQTRTEPRKLLLVLCDGYPYPGAGNTARCQKFFKKTVSEASRAHIDVVGFGICTDSVSHYFKNYVVLHELSDIVKEPLVYLDKYLRQGIRDGKRR